VVGAIGLELVKIKISRVNKKKNIKKCTVGAGDVWSPASYVEPLHQAPPVVVEVVGAIGRELVKKYQGLETHLRLESPVHRV